MTEGKENAKPRNKSSSDAVAPAKRLVPSKTTAFSSPQPERFPASNYPYPTKQLKSGPSQARFPATNFAVAGRASSKIIMREIRETHLEFNDSMMKIELMGYDDDFTSDESSYDSDESSYDSDEYDDFY